MKIRKLFLFVVYFIFFFCIFNLIKILLEKEYNSMEILDLAKLFLKSFNRVIILRCGGIFRHNSDVLSYWR